MSKRGRMRDLPGALAADCRGVATIEFALVVSILVFLVLNVIDVAYYAAARTQVENAAQAGAQAALQNCGIGKLPATVYCSGLVSNVTQAVQSTSLGSKVSLQSGSPSEGYYCVGASGSLQFVGAVSSTMPTDCSSVGMAANTPGDYVNVAVTYTFTSLFPGITLTQTLPSTLTQTAWVRVL